MCGRKVRVVSDVFGGRRVLGNNDDGGRAMLISGGVGLVGMMVQLVMGRAPLSVSVVSVAPEATLSANWKPGPDAFPFYVPADFVALDRANSSLPATDWLPDRPLNAPSAVVNETVAADLVNESTVAPEPATLWLLASGLIALGVTGLMQRRRHS